MLGLKGTWEAIKSANGPAQHILYGIWGFIIAGMYLDMGVPNSLVISWALASFITILVVIWSSKKALKRVLLLDVSLTALVLGLYVSTAYIYKPMSMEPVYYINTAEGMEAMQRMGIGLHDLSSWSMFISYILPCLVLILHGIYLANLVERQELEKKRFNNGKL